jgi:ABC-type glycerol-3-phosphate transport system substrate-binding protein
MKKVMLAFAVASIFAACSDSSSKSETKTDSTGVKDTSVTIKTSSDTTSVKDSLKIKTDTVTTKMVADPAKK